MTPQDWYAAERASAWRDRIRLTVVLLHAVAFVGAMDMADSFWRWQILFFGVVLATIGWPFWLLLCAETALYCLWGAR